MSRLGSISMESWVSGGGSCFDCQSSGSDHRCLSCGRLFCRKCIQSSGDTEFEKSDFCKFCYRAVGRHLKAEDSIEKSDLSVPNEKIPESPLSRFSDTRLAQFADSQQGSSPQSLCCYTSRSYEDEDAEDGGRHFFSPMSEASQDNSDTDAISVGTWNDFYSLKSSPMDSPSRAGDQEDNSPVLARADPQDQGTPGYFRKNRVEVEDLLENTNDCSYGNHVVYGTQDCQKAQPPLDFDNNYLLWYPPPPEDEEDDVETGFFGYDDDDDDGESNTVFSSGSFSTESTDTFSIKGKPNDANKEHLRSAVHGHFRALVCQLLQGESLHVGSGNDGEGWLEIVSSIAWQAGTFVKPDTGKGGSMDPGDYVKVKCISSGIPSNSTLIKGIVCTKNVKHKRMVSQHRNPKILLLGGSLEYQRAPNRLASINNIIQQESDHLKMAVSKIESHRPNVLMVEKSVSPYAQEYLLAKEISLVLNVKRTLLDRISRCTGAQIVTAVDNLTSAKLGQCEMFRIEKVLEECSSGTHPSKKSTKTLMFFEGCPRRLGCTVLLRGSCHEDLKKVKHVVQYASFAAYHLSLETSFLADEGASLPKFPSKPPMEISETMSANTCIEPSLTPSVPNTHINCPLPCSDVLYPNIDILGINSEQEKRRVSSEDISPTSSPLDPRTNGDCTIRSIPEVSCCVPKRSSPGFRFKNCQNSSQVRTAANILESEVLESSFNEGNISVNPRIIKVDHEQKVIPIDDGSVPSEYFSASDNHQSILVSLSSSCVVKHSVCERSQLFRIKFYGSFDKPLGRYLRDDLFDQTSLCRSCKEPAEAHIRCYTHQQGNLTINVRRLSSMKLPGERDGRIWMWHRCLKCEHKDGVPPAARRVVMSDAAWGLSFGKFLELSFSNHTTANRIASCGHSLQRDCLRFYGFGSMVAFFRYSPVDILSIQLPPQFLEFSCDLHQDWVKREAFAIFRKVESFYEEISTLLRDIEQRITATVCDSLKTSIHKHIVELKDLLKRERHEYDDLLPASTPNAQPSPAAADILELNRLRRCLLIDSYTWDRRLYLLDSVSKSKSLVFNADPQLSEILNRPKLNEWREESFCKDEGPGDSSEETMMKSLTLSCTFSNSLLSKQNEDTRLQILEYNSNNMVEMDLTIQSFGGYIGPAGFNLLSGQCYRHDEESTCDEVYNDASISEGFQSPETNLSDRIDLAWTGSGQILTSSSTGNVEQGTVGSYSLMANLTHTKVISPARVHSFDSALRFQSKISRGLSPSLHLSSFRSFDSSREFGKDPNRQAYTQSSPRATHSHTPGLIKSAAHIVNEEARLLLPQPGLDNMVIAVYENDPTSIISYAISSQEHASFIASKCRRLIDDEEPTSYPHSDDIQSQCRGSDEPQRLRASPMLDPKEHNFRISFDDESSTPGDKVKFSVISYFAKEFDALRKKCCPSEIDFIRSMSRCKRWKAQGGKSDVFFAKSLDERFIIKQVTKTELDSFEEFAPEYFKYSMESINSGSPTCLARVLGIYQVTNKHVKGGREVKMDLMVMENLFYRRNLSRVYDLKGSSRARYNSDTSGNKVLLDLNLLETLHTKPIFLGKKAKRILERAVWNDTSFLASIDVMDYSLLVGVDDERKELVIGIIDFMRQYTWDKHLETWVKASGILGGPRNTSPTVVSPKQYKKRFRKAMSSYFLTVPDQWPS